MGLIRCDHCGWGNNPEGSVRCQKCNQELNLAAQEIEPEVTPNPTPDMFETVKRTEHLLQDCRKCGYPLSSDTVFCPNCGAPTGYVPQSDPVQESNPTIVVPELSEAKKNAMKATVRDVIDMRCSDDIPVSEQLSAPVNPVDSANPILNQTVRIGDIPVNAESYQKKPVYPAVTKKIVPDTALFRLKPIDVVAQETFAFDTDTNASFEYDDGQWYINDESGTDSTFVSASRRIALEKGDVVLIGGRRYRFE